jgi:hypothetical protein
MTTWHGMMLPRSSGQDQLVRHHQQQRQQQDSKVLLKSSQCNSL